MSGNNGAVWSKEETILAFELYCKTPFGKIGKNNNEVKELAALLGRTPSSVALKMQNLAHFDPKLQARNITAMAHGSKLDSLVFEEFNRNIAELRYQSMIIKAKMHGETLDSVSHDIAHELGLDDLPPGKVKEQLVKTRIGQNFFRTTVLNSYGNKCCVTGLAIPQLLVASHIKPWAVSDENTERTNPKNGLCLNPFHDKAFDQGFMTINKDYKIIISNKLNSSGMDEITQNWFMSYKGQGIILPDKFEPGKEFIEYHNDVVFKG